MSVEVKESAPKPTYLDVSKFYREDHFKDIVVLFYAREMKELAEEMSAKSKGKIILANVSLNRFPDSFPNIFVHDAKALKWANVAFLATFHTPDVIFEQLSFMWALPKYLVKSLKIVLPFFPTGTMERVVTYGEVATAKTLAKMVSMTPLTQCGPSQLILLDIHALQNQFYFDDNVVPRLYSATDLLMLELAQLPEEEKKRLSIAFPDDGAHKRFASQFGSLECIICAKVRHEDKRIVTIKEGSCKDRHVIIVDDLVHSGGTLLECVKACQNNGAAKVSAFVTHAVFEQAAWKKFTKEGLGITTFYITNTHPMASELKDVKPFKVLSVAPLLMPILLNSET